MIVDRKFALSNLRRIETRQNPNDRREISHPIRTSRGPQKEHRHAGGPNGLVCLSWTQVNERRKFPLRSPEMGYSVFACGGLCSYPPYRAD